jgi:hypothetical protein
VFSGPDVILDPSLRGFKMEEIVEEVKASLHLDAGNGDEMERATFIAQVQKLVEYAENLEEEVFFLQNPMSL